MRLVEMSQAFVRAGLKLSSTIGPAGSAVPMLASAAGVGSGRFYEVFGDFDGYVHVIEQALHEEQRDLVERTLRSPAEPRQLLAVIRAVLNHAVSRRGAYGWVRAVAKKSPPMIASQRKHQRALCGQLEKACTGSSGAQGIAAAQLFVAALDDAALLEAQTGVANDDIREALAMFVATLRPEEMPCEEPTLESYGPRW